MKEQEKRCYVFSHFMLGPMAKGIQTLHSTVELFNKYIPNPSNDHYVEDLQYDILFDWSLNHKTVISLNPGVSGDMDDLVYFLMSIENPYPWADFHEDEYSLKGLRTAVSLILPEKIYEAASLFRKGYYFDPDNYGTILCENTSLMKSEEFDKLISYGGYNSFEMELVQILGQYRLAN
jgi:hypothetical protein